nr:AsnC family transcriptional regulator [uncultured Cohaesibacter sp.]
MGNDKANAKILELLQTDGRMSNAKQAERLPISETPCWRRLKKFEENGGIERWTCFAEVERFS